MNETKRAPYTYSFDFVQQLDATQLSQRSMRTDDSRLNAKIFASSLFEHCSFNTNLRLYSVRFIVYIVNFSSH